MVWMSVNADFNRCGLEARYGEKPERAHYRLLRFSQSARMMPIARANRIQTLEAMSHCIVA